MACLLQPTDGRLDNQQMIDERDFDARLDYALMLHGRDNAWLAAQFGPTGQQTVRGWRDRGRVGQPSVPKVRELLPLIRMDWLQEGILPELVSSSAEPSLTHDVRQSPPARRDVAILTQALKLVETDEALNGVFGWERKAEILLDVCAKLDAGEDPAVLGMKLTHQRKKGEASNGAPGTDGDGKRGK
jgi:hypothetical protein